MDEPQSSAPQLTGADLEIANTAERLSSALGIEGPQAEALRLALSDHATAVGSKSTAMIAGLFAPVFRMVEETRADVAELAKQRAQDRKVEDDYRRKMLDWRVELRQYVEQRFDALGTEVDTRVGALEEDFGTFRQEQTAFNDQSAADRADLRELISALPEAEQLTMIRRVQQEVRQLRVMLILIIIGLGLFFGLVLLSLLARGGQ